jgi:ubiquitin carboxyl-terminal hydrolase L5
MDMLNADLSLSNDVDRWKKARTARKKKGGARKSQAKPKKKDEEEPGFHFIAYVPIDGIVWRLDGMQRQPASLGTLLILDHYLSIANIAIQA